MWYSKIGVFREIFKEALSPNLNTAGPNLTLMCFEIKMGLQTSHAGLKNQVQVVMTRLNSNKVV